MGRGEQKGVVVPPGHQVRLYGLSEQPQVVRTPAGMIIAQLGFGGDDPTEMAEVFGEVAALRGERAPAVRWVDRAVALSDLFAPSPVSAVTASDVVIWSTHAEALADRLEFEPMDELLDRFRRAGGASQWLVIADPDPGVAALLRAVEQAGMRPVPCTVDRPFLAEVDRPDGLTVAAFVAGAVRQGNAPPPGQSSMRLRAPRLRRLLEQVMATSSDESWRHLLEELLDRKYPLLFFVEKGNRMSMRSWPGLGAALPVFADLRSLARAAAETGQPPGSYGVGGLDSRRLFAHAHENQHRVVMNVDSGEGPARYLLLEPAFIADLAAGRRRG